MVVDPSLLTLAVTLLLALAAAVWGLLKYVDRKIQKVDDNLDGFKEYVGDHYARRDDLAQIAGRIEGRMEAFAKTMTEGFSRIDQRIDDFFHR